MTARARRRSGSAKSRCVSARESRLCHPSCCSCLALSPRTRAHYQLRTTACALPLASAMQRGPTPRWFTRGSNSLGPLRAPLPASGALALSCAFPRTYVRCVFVIADRLCGVAVEPNRERIVVRHLLFVLHKSHQWCEAYGRRGGPRLRVNDVWRPCKVVGPGARGPPRGSPGTHHVGNLTLYLVVGILGWP
jgi:hypothetical protein